ncbi:murein biosynthesis integral membrane protein MurJ [Pseudoxanthomonas sp. SGNA-20]|uniref:murein biosynthesis integral membrane protein MurJ n=1 Tax=unclassified Pseudoxanthomonas TaxID=2645906 RepID=UPI0003143F10|nr:MULTISPECIES: murein biosynthesis integral membrane protein MurJ [unclassified Pseudoxanthomonas]RRN58539.1 murein biosynthesis integral membrane protein MurJ [Pseudoxanthomonas sp. SGNA-20]
MSGSRLLRSASLFSSLTFVSRVSGLVRDQVYAIVFGASPAMDAFIAAFRIPNFMRRLSAEGSFSMAFVPVLAEYKEKYGADAVRALVDRVTGALLAALLVLVAAVLLFAPWVGRLLVPGFVEEPETYALFVEMLRITFPYALFISLASLAGGILNTWQRFGVPALSPVLLNLALIAAAVVGGHWLGGSVKVLAWGVLVAGILQLAFHLPALAQLGLLPRPRLDLAHAGVRRVMTLMVPTLFGSSVVQFNLLINTQLASLLVGGSMTWLYYSDRLLEFPLGMFGVAIGTVILPHLSSRHASADPDGFSRGLDWGFRLCVLIGVPATLGLVLCARPLVATLFQYGEFGAEDARMSALSLVAQSLAVPAFLLVKVLAPAFYSRQDTRSPVRAAVFAVLVNVASTLLFFALLLYATDTGRQALAAAGGSAVAALGTVRGAHALLALAVAVAGWTNALQLAWMLRRAGVYRRQPGWGRLLLQVGAGALALAVVVLGLGWLWPDWSAWAWWERAWRLAVMVGAGAAAYGALLLALGLRPRELRG